MTASPAALAFARRLDALLPSADGALEHTLVFEIGELLGGLGVDGFEADLNTAMDDAADHINDAAFEWNEYGDDGRAFASYATECDAEAERELVAAEWLRDATALLEPVAACVTLAGMTSADDVRGVLRSAA